MGKEQGQGQRLFPLCMACGGRDGVTQIVPILSLSGVQSLWNVAILEEGVCVGGGGGGGGAISCREKEEGISFLPLRIF